MNGNLLLPDDRMAAYRLALEIARLVRDTPAAVKAPFRRAVLNHAAYLLLEEAILGPEPLTPIQEDTN